MLILRQSPRGHLRRRKMNYLKSNKIFNGHGIHSEDLDNHVIVSRDNHMVDINLSVFTENSFYSWFSYESNRDIIEEIKDFDPNKVDPPDTVLDPEDLPAGQIELQDAFNALTEPRSSAEFGDFTYLLSGSGFWRNKGRNGEYVNFDRISEWEYTDKNDNKYTYLDVISSFEPEIYCDSQNEIPCLIKINDKIQQKLAEFPNTDSDDWNRREKAAYEFFVDINASQQRCLKWSTELTFLEYKIEKNNRGLAEIEQEYNNKKRVDYEIYFYGIGNLRKSERKVGQKEINIVAPRKDAIGRSYLLKKEGKNIAAIHQENPKSHIGAPLDLKYTEFLNKWESGTPQMLAVVTTEIPSVQKPEINVFTESSASDILDHENGLQVIHGSAIPITMDQCNPLQWCPTYIRDERYREEGDLSKIQVPIYNVSDIAAFNPGDLVVLNRIDGVWVPMPFTPGFARRRVGSVIEWDFTYLMTNTDNFFRNVDNEKFTYDDFEKAIHLSYYSGGKNVDLLNIETYNKNGDVRYAKVENNFFQVTSWDFMGPDIGGLRNGNALGCTQFEYHPDNESVNGANLGKDTLDISGPFFGCVFPDGYNEEAKIQNLEDVNKTFHLRTITSKDESNNQHIFFKDVLSTTNVFDNNKNSNILPSSRGGMFAHANINQLPADIGVNSSPDDKNGRPLSTTRMIPTGQLNLQESFREYFKNHTEGVASGLPKRYSWLYKHPVDEDTFVPDDRYASAFSIKPLNNERLQFRPLKTETYACFELKNKFDVDVRSEERGEFARRMWNSQGDDENPISVLAKERNKLPTENKLIDENLGLIYEKSVKFPRPRSNNNPDLLWARSWIEAAPDNQGNAFGIIGASCTATYDTKIQFITDNFIGMQPWFLSNFLYNSWGRGSYNDVHTTQLSVRAFHAWPKEQTIYDSRFFSVHHFNPGVEKQEPLEGEYAEEVKVSGLITDVDFLEVLTPGLGGQINFDTDPFESGVSVVRRGKMLPYKYKYNTIGVTSSYARIPDDIPDDSVDDPLGLTAQDVNILIKSSGTEYVEDDRFIVSGGSGRGILLKPLIEGEGGVVGFDVIHSGYDYLKENFPKGDVVLNRETGSSLTVIPSGEVAGNGLSAIIVGGTVVETPVFTDEKPRQIFFRKISPDPPTDGGLNAIADVSYDISVGFGDDIPESYKSADGKYDLFFYFQNDISHTWDWDRGQLPPAYEQKLDLQINLDPDT